MAQEAELKINSSSVERTTVAVDALYTSLLKMGKGAEGAENASDNLTGSQKRQEAALKSSNIAAEKARSLLLLEQKQLDKNSDEYAKLKGAILAKDLALKKGIKTSSKEFTQLEKNTIAAQKDTAALKRLAMQQKKVTKSSKKMSEGVKSTTDWLDKSTKQVQLIDGPLGGIASRMTALSSIMKGGALPAAALAISVGLVGKALWDGANVADRNQVAMKGLEAQLLATGHASGFTAENLDTFSRSLAFATLDNTAGVKELVGVMLGFDEVSGDAFTRAISLSQDLGIAMKQSPVTAAKTLGKVLQNPIQNYKQLKRSGIEFNKTQKDSLKLAAKDNDLRKQQEIILKAVESKYKGIAKAQTDSLSGDKDTLGQNWEELWELLGEKVLPVFRAITQAANLAVVATRELFETDAETEFREWAIEGEHLTKTTEEMAESMDILKARLVEVTAEQLKASEAMKEQLRSSSKSSQWAIRAVLEKETEIEVIKKQIKAYEDLGVAQELSKQGKGFDVSEAAANAIDKTEIQLEQQIRLTQAFLETGDTRSVAYQKVKIAIDAENIATKTNLSMKSEEFKLLQENLMALSGLTEQRIKHNTVLQKQKGLESKQRGLEKEIALFALAKSGIIENSEAYVIAAAGIDAKNSATQAGFAIGSKEHQQLEKQYLALAKLQVKANEIKEFSAAGFRWNDLGMVLVEGSKTALRHADAELKDSIWGLLVTGEIDQAAFDERMTQVTDSIHERLKSDLIPLGFTLDEVGNAVLLDSVEAVEVERQEKLKEMRSAWYDSSINDETLYAERYAAIQAEYDEKAIKAKEKAYEQSAKHKKLMQQAEVAGSLASGLENLANVKKNNKALNKAAKLMSMFQASTSLVDALGKAYALGWPAGIPAAAAAFAQGTQLIGMASNLNEPSYANGGVDIKGAGTGRSDSISAKIANGESVITATGTNRHKETLKRINAGLDISGGRGNGGAMSLSTSIVVQGDASENTISLIEDKLRDFETRVETIANGSAMQTIQEQQMVGGLFNEI